MSVDEPRAPGYQPSLTALRRRWWLLLALPMLGASVAFLMSPQAVAQYTSSATVLVEKPALLPGQPQNVGIALMANEQRLADSADVVDRAVAAAGEAGTLPVSVELVKDSSVLVFTSVGTEPGLVQRAAQARAEAYLESRTAAAAATLARAVKPLDDEAARIAARIVEAQRQAAAAAADSSQREALQTQIAGLVGQRSSVEQARSAFADPSELRAGTIIRPALPAVPTGASDRAKGVALGLFVGLAGAVGLAFLADRLDPRVRDAATLGRLLGDPPLAVIRDSHRDVDFLRAGALLAALCTQQGVRSVLVTSPAGRRRRSTADAWNGPSPDLLRLARGVAATGCEVTCVTRELTADVHAVPDHDDGAARGTRARRRPAEREAAPPAAEGTRPALRSVALRRPVTTSEAQGLLDRAGATADIVLVEAPPFGAEPDALVLAPLVDTVLLLEAADCMTQAEVHAAAEELTRIGARLIGSVLTRPAPGRAAGTLVPAAQRAAVVNDLSPARVVGG